MRSGDDGCWRSLFLSAFQEKIGPGTPKVFLGSRSPKSAVPYVTTEAQKEICLVVEEISLSGCFHPSLALPLIDTLLWSTELCEVCFTQWQPYRENCRLETVLRYSYIWWPVRHPRACHSDQVKVRFRIDRKSNTSWTARLHIWQLRCVEWSFLRSLWRDSTGLSLDSSSLTEVLSFHIVLGPDIATGIGIVTWPDVCAHLLLTVSHMHFSHKLGPPFVDTLLRCLMWDKLNSCHAMMRAIMIQMLHRTSGAKRTKCDSFWFWAERGSARPALVARWRNERKEYVRIPYRLAD